MIITACETAFGWVGIAASEAGLVELTLPEPTEAAARQRLQERHGPGQADDGRLASLKARLQAYFRGEAVDFADLPLDTHQGTEFQQRVWAATRAIPRGQTRSYGALAQEVGSPGAARAVGQAMARNPWPIVVPCHRVVGHDGRLTGFGGGLEMKRRLLEMERVSESATR
ncbi:MAG: methylated-DNA--[protein]-cysteine S-methyltransferase [Anaerolineae bacterium]|nr:methylated-DNA--[protein]-cysteine S-methyltransferase [Anaerolineae bacterium]